MAALDAHQLPQLEVNVDRYWQRKKMSRRAPAETRHAGLACKSAETQIRDAERLGEAAAAFAKAAKTALGRGGEWK